MLAAEFYLFHSIGVICLFLSAWAIGLAWRTSMFTLGAQGIVCVGAYAAAAVIAAAGPLDNLATGSRVGLFLLTLAAGMVASAVAGFAMVRSLMHVGSDYFAVGTLALAEGVRVAVSNLEWLGGSQGFIIDDVLPLHVLGLARVHVYALLALALALAAGTVSWWTRRAMSSPLGLAFAAVEGDAHRAQYLGVEAWSVRTWSLVVGALPLGLLGAAGLHLKQSIVPDDFSFSSSIDALLVAVLVGGRDRFLLPAATAVYLLGETLRSNWLGLDSIWAAYREMMVSTVLLAAILLPAVLRRLGRRLSA